MYHTPGNLAVEERYFSGGLKRNTDFMGVDGAAREQVISNGGDGGRGVRGEGSWETDECRDAMRVGGTYQL